MFDAYNRKARLYPSLIAGAAAIVAALTLVPSKQLGLPLLGAGLVSGIFVYVLSDVARRRGKSVERVLFEKWGGKPSTMMLRHADDRLESATRARYVEFLARQIGGKPFSSESELAEPTAADAFYEQCTAWLRENTRDTKKFKILFEENIAYGFRRNLFALRVPALWFDALLLVGCILGTIEPSSLISEVVPLVKLAAIATFAAAHGLFMYFYATENSVREASQTYARQLLLSCETLAGSLGSGRSGKAGAKR
jgi:hypothetical protein